MSVWKVADVYPFLRWAKVQKEPIRSTISYEFERMMQALDGELQVTVNGAVYADYWAGRDAALCLQKIAFRVGFPAAAEFFFNISAWCCESIEALLLQEMPQSLVS
jgi:hypothetical protein